MNDSYGSEYEFIGRSQTNGGATKKMVNGNNNGTKVNWTVIRDVAQYLLYPILAALFYLVAQNFNLDRRLAVIELLASRPIVDVESIRKIAIIEDRQQRNIATLKELREEVDRHRDKSTYDKRQH